MENRLVAWTKLRLRTSTAQFYGKDWRYRMRNKKVLGGLIVVAVLLSGTTVFYIPGVNHPGVAPAFAMPSGGFLCAVGVCMRYVGTRDGCGSFPCCSQYVDRCAGISHVAITVPQWESADSGSCYVLTGSVPACDIYDCDGPLYCPLNGGPPCNAFFSYTSTSYDVIWTGTCEAAW